MNSQPVDPAPDRESRVIYWIVGGVVLTLLVIGLIAYSGEKETREAQEKAQQLTQEFEQAGLPVPADQDIIVRSLGSDGGAVCENPANALGRAILNDQLTNGANFVGRRPIIADRQVVQGELLILQTYCPDELQEFRDKFDDLDYDDVVKG